MATASKYLKGIHSKFDHHATWLPDEKMRLGDVGVFVENRFYGRTTLSALNIRTTIRTGHGGGNWDHSSGNDVTVDLSAKAHSSIANGAASVKFGSKGAFLFQAFQCQTTTIENMAEVGQEILLAFRAKEFERDWIVIDRIVSCVSGTILIADSESAEVCLEADAKLESISAIADASLGVRMTQWRGEVSKFVATSGLTPMFGASRLNGRLFGGAKLGPMRGEATDDVLAPLESLPFG